MQYRLAAYYSGYRMNNAVALFSFFSIICNDANVLFGGQQLDMERIFGRASENVKDVQAWKEKIEKEESGVKTIFFPLKFNRSTSSHTKMH